MRGQASFSFKNYSTLRKNSARQLRSAVAAAPGAVGHRWYRPCLAIPADTPAHHHATVRYWSSSPQQRQQTAAQHPVSPHDDSVGDVLGTNAKKSHSRRQPGSIGRCKAAVIGQGLLKAAAGLRVHPGRIVESIPVVGTQVEDDRIVAGQAANQAAAPPWRCAPAARPHLHSRGPVCSGGRCPSRRPAPSRWPILRGTRRPGRRPSCGRSGSRPRKRC